MSTNPNTQPTPTRHAEVSSLLAQHKNELLALNSDSFLAAKQETLRESRRTELGGITAALERALVLLEAQEAHQPATHLVKD